MFRVRVTKEIWPVEEHKVDAWLKEKLESKKPGPVCAVASKELSFPFAPYPGLEVSDGADDFGPLVRVVWSEPEQVFKCSVKSEYPGRAVDSQISYEELLQFAAAAGWAVRK